jgi:hypothetical protein
MTLPSLILSKTFTIKWVSSSNIDHYEVEISEDQSFTSPIIKNTTLTSLEVKVSELRKTINIKEIFYIRIKAVFYTGQNPSYSPIREFKIQKIYQDVFIGDNGSIYLPSKFTLDFIMKKYQSPQYRGLKLYFRLGRKNKTYKYLKGTHIKCKTQSGKKEIFYYFGDNRNRNRTKWQRIIINIDKTPPKLRISCGNKNIFSSDSLTAGLKDTIIAKTKDKHSGIHPNGEILYSTDQQNPKNKKIFVQYQEDISIETLLKKLELNPNLSHKITLYFKAIDNVGNISPIIRANINYSPTH